MKTYFYPALLAPLIMVLTMQSGYAECGINDRERYNHSFCLDADIDDNDGNFFTQSRWTLDNICTGYSNSLKFKVDLRSAPDKSIHGCWRRFKKWQFGRKIFGECTVARIVRL